MVPAQELCGLMSTAIWHTAGLSVPSQQASTLTSGCTVCCRYGEAGALWHIFARADTHLLRSWLVQNLHSFQHEGRQLRAADVQDPVHDQVQIQQLPSPALPSLCASWGSLLPCMPGRCMVR